MSLSINSLATSLTPKASSARGDVYISSLDAETGLPDKTLVFQYFPESIEDDKAPNYQQKEIFGGSLPLYQWVNSGERLISFMAPFTSDVDFYSAGPGSAYEMFQRVRQAGLQRQNVDIRTALTILRSFSLPHYADGVTHPPPKLRLWIPNSGIGVTGGVDASAAVNPDSIICLMTQCQISYKAFFRSGLPRIAEASLAFAQIPQFLGKITFPQSPLQAPNAELESEGGPFLPYVLKARKRGGY